jgi:transmembrane 9 superfamily protein 2/4
MQENVNCSIICNSEIPKEDAVFINEAIEDHYLINWIVDGLPAAQLVSNEEYTTIGFKLGNEIVY